MIIFLYYEWGYKSQIIINGYGSPIIENVNENKNFKPLLHLSMYDQISVAGLCLTIVW